jgi:hypothetical protein
MAVENTLPIGGSPTSDCLHCVEQSNCDLFKLCNSDEGKLEGCVSWLMMFNSHLISSSNYTVELACMNAGTQPAINFSITTKIIRSRQCTSCVHSAPDSGSIPAYCK